MTSTSRTRLSRLTPSQVRDTRVAADANRLPCEFTATTATFTDDPLTVATALLLSLPPGQFPGRSVTPLATVVGQALTRAAVEAAHPADADALPAPEPDSGGARAVLALQRAVLSQADLSGVGRATVLWLAALGIDPASTSGEAEQAVRLRAGWLPCMYCQRVTAPDRQAAKWTHPTRGPVCNCYDCAGYVCCPVGNHWWDNGENNPDPGDIRMCIDHEDAADAAERFAAAYLTAAAKHTEAQRRLTALIGDAEDGRGTHNAADDFRHYGYAEATDAVLLAAQALLTTVGYEVPDRADNGDPK